MAERVRVSFRTEDDSYRPLLEGTAVPGAPTWHGWSRVEADGPINLPPCFKVESMGQDDEVTR